MRLFTIGVFTILAVFLMLAVSSTPAAAAYRVRGYTKSNGTYVQPYYRSSPNSFKIDNYSSRGNYNPYSGKIGTIKPWKF